MGFEALSRFRRFAVELLRISPLRASIGAKEEHCEHIGGVYLGYDSDEDAMRRYCLRCKQPFLERYKPL